MTSSAGGAVQAERVLIRQREPGALSVPPPSRAPLRFHASVPGYVPTPLRAAPRTAQRLGVAEALVKDESARLGLPSFKVLGASWAVHHALVERAGAKPDELPTFAELVDLAGELRPLTLSAATDGNHGRAVAHMARLLGLSSRIYVPRGMTRARIDAIAGEGAEVTVVDGGYNGAVRRSAEDAGERCLVISDTSWPGYTDVPRWVIEGYSTIFDEIEHDLDRRGGDRPDVVVVQIGVGALAAATIRHFWGVDHPRPLLIGVEPTQAACVLESMVRGDISTLPGEQESIMSGLNCDTPSLVAWPLVSAGIDVYTAVEDARVPEAMRLLAEDGVIAGETGAAGVAALLRLHDDGGPPLPRPLDGRTRVLLLSTEGATDPGAYRRLVGERLS